jgi:hypothetical protein
MYPATAATADYCYVSCNSRLLLYILQQPTIVLCILQQPTIVKEGRRKKSTQKNADFLCEFFQFLNKIDFFMSVRMRSVCEPTLAQYV